MSQNSYWFNLKSERGTYGQMLHINLLRGANIIGDWQNKVDSTRKTIKQKQENQLRRILYRTELLMNIVIIQRRHYGGRVWCVQLIIFSLSREETHDSD